jgi:hypothetical protein
MTCAPECVAYTAFRRSSVYLAARTGEDHNTPHDAMDPIFAQLLRPAVEAYYEVQTTVPVGDAPREADFVLLRRTAPSPPPFRGLWRHLTAWNVLEFKGPTVTPRRGDIDRLIELGLGIDRRLRRPGLHRTRRPVLREEVSFWYLANRLVPRPD